MKQTAVEWLANSIINLEERLRLKEINLNDFIEEKDLLVEQAKEMEKEQIIYFHVNCMEDGYNIETDKTLTENIKLDIKAHAEQYYNETFKSE